MKSLNFITGFQESWLIPNYNQLHLIHVVLGFGRIHRIIKFGNLTAGMKPRTCHLRVVQITFLFPAKSCLHSLSPPMPLMRML